MRSYIRHRRCVSKNHRKDFISIVVIVQMAVNTVNKAREKHQASSFQFLTDKVGS